MTQISTAIVFGVTVAAVWLRAGQDIAIGVGSLFIIAIVFGAVIRRKRKAK